MLIRDIRNGQYRRVMDHSVLCELLHPKQGGETGDLPCSIAYAIVPAGEATLPHRLRTSAEFYYILAGTAKMHIGGESEDLASGQIVQIPPGAVQYIENTGSGDLCFLCIVVPAWQEKDEELVL